MALYNHQAIPLQIEPPAPLHTLSPDCVSVYSNHGSNANSIAQEENSYNHVNDPVAASLHQKAKTSLNNVHYFFDESGDKVVCNRGVQSCHLFHTYFLLNKFLLPN